MARSTGFLTAEERAGNVEYFKRAEVELETAFKQREEAQRNREQAAAEKVWLDLACRFNFDLTGEKTVVIQQRTKALKELNQAFADLFQAISGTQPDWGFNDPQQYNLQINKVLCVQKNLSKLQKAGLEACNTGVELASSLLKDSIFDEASIKLLTESVNQVKEVVYNCNKDNVKTLNQSLQKVNQKSALWKKFASALVTFSGIAMITAGVVATGGVALVATCLVGGLIASVGMTLFGKTSKWGPYQKSLDKFGHKAEKSVKQAEAAAHQREADQQPVPGQSESSRVKV